MGEEAIAAVCAALEGEAESLRLTYPTEVDDAIASALERVAQRIRAALQPSEADNGR